MAKFEKNGRVDDVLEGGALAIFGAGPPRPSAEASTASPGVPIKQQIAARAARELSEQDTRNGVKFAPTPKPSSAPSPPKPVAKPKASRRRKG